MGEDIPMPAEAAVELLIVVLKTMTRPIFIAHISDMLSAIVLHDLRSVPWLSNGIHQSPFEPRDCSTACTRYKRISV